MQKAVDAIHHDDPKIKKYFLKNKGSHNWEK